SGAAGTDELKCGLVIARRKDQNIFGLVPPMQAGDGPEASFGSGAGERCGLASVIMTRSTPGGPRVGLVPKIEHKENKKGIRFLDLRRPSQADGFQSSSLYL
ncbi:MAG TPA: hypothetical protein VEW26_13295, partial [Allosphingosinicella sp.]|nr:hypothetical protein [Allosphingosinicella sp.]